MVSEKILKVFFPFNIYKSMGALCCPWQSEFQSNPPKNLFQPAPTLWALHEI